MREYRLIEPTCKGDRTEPKLSCRMTPKQLRTALRRLGLTQVAAAHVLGVAPRTVRQWLASDRRIPEPAARLLATWVAHPELLLPSRNRR